MDIKLASTQAHLVQIRQLMLANQKSNLNPGIAASDGFLSFEYSADLLSEMMRTTPPIIAASKSEDTPDKEIVVGYALAVTTETALKDEELAVPVRYLETQGFYQGTPIKSLKYLIMGQICVREGYRGQGVLAGMYKEFSRVYREKGFDVVVTEVAKTNERSMRAHQKAGWIVFDSMESKGVAWDMILLDLLRGETKQK
ncbi:hypothetical protein BDR26DRAFT_872168 [Obelidium mucronatum]|nr:hypothetical protein BDR26DRAFT_872168 [Obelidium mucronatum]